MIPQQEKAQNINLSCYRRDIEMLDALVEHYKRHSTCPNKVNRGSVLRGLIQEQAMALNLPCSSL